MSASFVANARAALADGAPILCDSKMVANGITLGPNMPNPFNAYTLVPYALDVPHDVHFELIDAQGKVVRAEHLGRVGAGAHHIDLDAHDLAPGIYSYVLLADLTRLTGRLVVADH